MNTHSHNSRTADCTTSNCIQQLDSELSIMGRWEWNFTVHWCYANVYKVYKKTLSLSTNEQSALCCSLVTCCMLEDTELNATWRCKWNFTIHWRYFSVFLCWLWVWSCHIWLQFTSICFHMCYEFHESHGRICLSTNFRLTSCSVWLEWNATVPINKWH